MNQEKLERLLEVVSGLKSYEWSRIKQQVEMLFNSKAAKVEFDDLELEKLKTNIQKEFRK